MSALEHLRAVGRGETPADDGLLENVRCSWGRGEALGHENLERQARHQRAWEPMFHRLVKPQM